MIQLNATITLIESNPTHAEQLLATVNANRDHLATFLPWVPYMLTSDDFTLYLKNCQSYNQQGLEYSYNIFENDDIVGRIGLSPINKANKIANIGYWLAAGATSKGIITNAVKKMLHIGFTELQLNRLEIKAAVENYKSRAIAEKSGFIFEGILRQAELVNNRYYDLALFSLLKEAY